MNNITAAKILMNHLQTIEDDSCKIATEIAIETLLSDAKSDYEKITDKGDMTLLDYLGLTERDYQKYVELEYHKIKEKILEAIKLRDVIVSIMSYCGVNCIKTDLKNSLNACYHQMEVDSCLVIEDYYGFPKSIYTPLGYIRISSTISYVGNVKEKINAILDTLGITTFKEVEKTNNGDFGGLRKCSGVVKYREEKDYIGYTDANQLYIRILKEEGLLDGEND